MLPLQIHTINMNEQGSNSFPFEDINRSSMARTPATVAAYVTANIKSNSQSIQVSQVPSAITSKKGSLQAQDDGTQTSVRSPAKHTMMATQTSLDLPSEPVLKIATSNKSQIATQTSQRLAVGQDVAPGTQES
jgi:hypothetical protein